MTNFRIHLRPETYRDGDFGIVYITLDELPFPSENWTDFGKTIIPWWLDAVRKLRLGEKETVCSFMDGPYRYSIKKISDDIWQIQLLEEREKVKIHSTKNVSAENIINEILTAYLKIVELYKSENNLEKVLKLEEFREQFL